MSTIYGSKIPFSAWKNYLQLGGSFGRIVCLFMWHTFNHNEHEYMNDVYNKNKPVYTTQFDVKIV